MTRIRLSPIMRAFGMRRISNADIDAVFTPAAIARKNFVHRAEIDVPIETALKTTGYQLLLTGRSGTGKTTHAFNRIESLYGDPLNVSCNDYRTVALLVNAAFDQLAAAGEGFYETRRKVKRESSRKTESVLKLGFKHIGEVGGQESRSHQEGSTIETEMERPKAILDGRALANAISRFGRPLIIDDVHLMPYEEFGALANLLREFQQCAARNHEAWTKLVVIGTDIITASTLTRHRPDLGSRLVHAELKMFAKAELLDIITNGMNILGLKLGEPYKNAIADFSQGDPSTCHGVCQHLCYISAEKNYRGVLDMADCEKAFKNYARTQRALLHDPLRKARQYRLMRSGPDGDELMTIIANNVDQCISIDRLFSHVSARYEEMTSTDLEEMVFQMSREENGQFIEMDRDRLVRFTRPVGIMYFQMMKGESHPIITEERARHLEEVLRLVFCDGDA